MGGLINSYVNTLSKVLRIDLIVDVECYYVNSRYIIKEICFYNYYLNSFQNYFIKTKTYHNSENKWLIKNYHKIDCNYGTTPYSFIKKHYFDNANIVFLANGKQKIDILSKFTSNKIIDINTIYRIEKLTIFDYNLTCEYPKHIENPHCALFKVQSLANSLCNIKQETLV